MKLKGVFSLMILGFFLVLFINPFSGFADGSPCMPGPDEQPCYAELFNCEKLDEWGTPSPGTRIICNIGGPVSSVECCCGDSSGCL
jgi:hypothetical protein